MKEQEQKQDSGLTPVTFGGRYPLPKSVHRLLTAEVPTSIAHRRADRSVRNFGIKQYLTIVGFRDIYLPSIRVGISAGIFIEREDQSVEQ